jgi:hypothetical protein
LTEPNNNLIGDTTWIHYPSPRRQKARHHGLLSHGQVLSLNQNYWHGRKQKPGDRAACALLVGLSGSAVSYPPLPLRARHVSSSLKEINGPVRLDLSAQSAAIQQCFSLTTNQQTVLSA